MPLKKIKKPERLLHRAEFLRAAASGKKFVCPAFILQVHAAEGADAPRYGLTATKKLGGAVVRNRARRRLRALAQDVLLAKASAADYVLIARQAALTRSFAELRGDMEKALKVLKCLK